MVRVIAERTATDEWSAWFAEEPETVFRSASAAQAVELLFANSALNTASITPDFASYTADRLEFTFKKEP